MRSQSAQSLALLFLAASTLAPTPESHASAFLRCLVDQMRYALDIHKPLSVSWPLRSTITDAQAARVFRQLRRLKRIPRYNRDGCAQRAHETAYQLELRGIESQKIFAQVANGAPYFMIPNLLNPNEMVEWSWHVAAAVQVEHPDGRKSWQVFDTSISDRPLEASDWLAHFSREPVSFSTPLDADWTRTLYYFAHRYVYMHYNRNQPPADWGDQLGAARKVLKEQQDRVNQKERRNRH